MSWPPVVSLPASRPHPIFLPHTSNAWAKKASYIQDFLGGITMLLGFVLGLVLGVPGVIVAPIVSRAEGRGSMVLGAFLGMVLGIVAWSALAGALTGMSATSPFYLGP